MVVALSTARSRLRAAVTGTLIPALRSLGFEGPASIDGQALLHEYRRASSRGTHVLVIQFEKYKRPRFVLNLHIDPPEGLEQLRAQGGTLVSGRVKAKPGPGLSSWFRADRPWWQRILLQKHDTTENDAVAFCVSLLPEVEAWWTALSPSAHIDAWPVRYRGTGT